MIGRVFKEILGAPSPSLTIGIVKQLINFRFLFQFLNHQFIVFNYINCALLFHTSIALWNGTPIKIICSNVYKTFMDSWTENLCLNCVIILYCCGKCGYLSRSLPENNKKIIFIDMKIFFQQTKFTRMEQTDQVHQMIMIMMAINIIIKMKAFSLHCCINSLSWEMMWLTSWYTFYHHYCENVGKSLCTTASVHNFRFLACFFFAK